MHVTNHLPREIVGIVSFLFIVFYVRVGRSSLHTKRVDILIANGLETTLSRSYYDVDDDDGATLGKTLSRRTTAVYYRCSGRRSLTGLKIYHRVGGEPF